MSKFRKVSTGMWADRKFRALSKPQPNGQTLWQWLITGSRTTQIPGVVIGRLEVLAAELEWPAEAFREGFSEVASKGMAKADFEAGLVWLPKAPLHNKPDSPNVVRSWRSTWDDVPECPLKYEVWRALKTFAEGWGEGWLKAFLEGCAQPSPNQEQEQEQEQDLSSDTASPPPEPLRLRIADQHTPRFDFEALYQRYPRKRGKGPGLETCLAEIRTQSDFLDLGRAIDAYALERKGEDEKFTLQFDTFMSKGRWRDYVPTAAPAKPRSLLERMAAGEVP